MFVTTGSLCTAFGVERFENGGWTPVAVNVALPSGSSSLCCYYYCDSGMGPTKLTRIDPGMSAELEWDAREYLFTGEFGMCDSYQTDVPEVALVPVPAGTYRFSMLAFSYVPDNCSEYDENNWTCDSPYAGPPEVFSVCDAELVATSTIEIVEGQDTVVDMAF